MILPTPVEIRALREKYGLTQKQAAVLVLSKERTWRHWESVPGTAGKDAARQMPANVWLLFRACLAYPEIFEELRQGSKL